MQYFCSKLSPDSFQHLLTDASEVDKPFFMRHVVLDIQIAGRLVLENKKAALQIYLTEITLKIKAPSRI